VIVLQLLHQGPVELRVHGGEDASLGNGAVEDLLDS
jgi:hypothetical protein